MSLLDVGCGPATITMDFARILAPALVAGVDTEEAVLDRARSEAEANGADVRFGVADANRLPFPAGYFDVVHAHQLLQHLADPVAVLREMARVCRPGGLVAARESDYSAMTWYPAEPALDDWLDLYQRVARRNGGEPDAGRHLLAWTHDAGFEDVTASASAWCFATPEDRAWWGETWAERVTSSTFADQAIKHGMADREELVRLANGWRRWMADRDGWFAILHGEVLCRVPEAG
jgi:SAM-dependent methyltransferase